MTTTTTLPLTTGTWTLGLLHDPVTGWVWG
jgi:hypothetical protein